MLTDRTDAGCRLLRKQKGFREQLDLRMDEYAARRFGLHYEFHPVPDAVLKGTATAAMAI